MSERSLETDPFNRGRTVRVSRQELASDSGEKVTQSQEAALLKCFQKLAILPRVEGIVLSQTKVSRSLYYTVIARSIFSGDEEARETFKAATDALHELGDTLDEMMPGSFINLAEGRTFANAARHLRSKRNTAELDLLGIMRFVD